MATFLATAGLFGILRGNVIHWLTTQSAAALGGDHIFGLMPYLMKAPLLHVGQASLQEVFGWIFALYLGWALAEQVLMRWPESERTVTSTVALVALFMVCIAYSVEATAGALGWWTWTIPVTSRDLVEVPAAGLWAWFSVSVDLFLPLMLWLHRQSFGLGVRIASLLLFPIHMGMHLVDVAVGGMAIQTFITPSNAMHWLMLLGLVGLTLMSQVRTSASVEARARSGWTRFIPSGVGIMLLTVISIGIGPLAGRWDLFAAVGPLFVFTLLSSRSVPLWLVALPALGFAPLAGGRGIAALICLGLALLAAKGGRALKRPGRGLFALGSTVVVLVLGHTLAVDWAERSYLKSRLGEFPSEQAKEISHKVLTFHPSPVALHMKTAQALRARGLLEAAEQEYRLACGREPHLVWARSQLGTVLTSLGRPDEAIVEIDRVLALAPQAYQLHHNLGVALLVAGRLPEARTAFEHAMDLAPSGGEALSVIALARLEFSTGRHDVARDRLQQAVLEHPSWNTVKLELAQFLETSGDLAGAELLLRELLVDMPIDERVLCRLANLVAQDTTRIREAHILATRAVDSRESVRSLETLSGILQKQGRMTEAVSVLRRARSRCRKPVVCRRIEAQIHALRLPH